MNYWSLWYRNINPFPTNLQFPLCEAVSQYEAVCWATPYLLISVSCIFVFEVETSGSKETLFFSIYVWWWWWRWWYVEKVTQTYLDHERIQVWSLRYVPFHQGASVISIMEAIGSMYQELTNIFSDYSFLCETFYTEIQENVVSV